MKSRLILDIKKGVPYTNEENNSFIVEYSTSEKFHNDKINFENNEYHLVLDGVVLNKKSLLEKYNEENWTKLVIRLLNEIGDDFFKLLKGSYYGFIFIKKLNKWSVFSDHIGSKPIYYFENSEQFCFSNDYLELINYLKKQKIDISLNENAAYLMISYGFVFEDITISNEVKRLLVGHSIKIIESKLSLSKFFTLDNKEKEYTEDQAIEALDVSFRESVKLAFEKDKEYGYEHVACLSGGLDSRMTVWVAHELGYKDQYNITFSQSDYLDETVAKEIARDLKHEWIFKYLDNGTFLKNIEDITRTTGGNVLYYGLSHAESLYSKLNFQKLGLLHSGQLGDVVISTYNSTLNPNQPFKFGDGAFSKKFIHRIPNFKLKETYKNEEMFKMYIRGFYGVNQGLLASMNYTETSSPFYDIDFLQLALSIPLKLRYNHDLYIKWINKKYPEAAKYIWEREKVPVNYPYWVKIKGKKVPLKQIISRVKNKIGLNKFGSNTKHHMNPLQYWYNTNPELRNWIDNYINDHLPLLDSFPELKKDCLELYNSKEWTGKIQVMSLLSAVKLIKD